MSNDEDEASNTAYRNTPAQVEARADALRRVKAAIQKKEHVSFKDLQCMDCDAFKDRPYDKDLQKPYTNGVSDLTEEDICARVAEANTAYRSRNASRIQKDRQQSFVDVKAKIMQRRHVLIRELQNIGANANDSKNYDDILQEPYADGDITEEEICYRVAQINKYGDDRYFERVKASIEEHSHVSAKDLRQIGCNVKPYASYDDALHQPYTDGITEEEIQKRVKSVNKTQYSRNGKKRGTYSATQVRTLGGHQGSAGAWDDNTAQPQMAMVRP